MSGDWLTSGVEAAVPAAGAGSHRDSVDFPLLLLDGAKRERKRIVDSNLEAM